MFGGCEEPLRDVMKKKAAEYIVDIDIGSTATAKAGNNHLGIK